MDTKYRALTIVITVYRIAAILTLFTGVAAGVMMLLSPTIDLQRTVTGDFEVISGTPAVGPGIALIAVSLLAALSLFAFGELIQLLIDMETHTRQTAFYLSRMRRKG